MGPPDRPTVHKPYDRLVSCHLDGDRTSLSFEVDPVPIVVGDVQPCDVEGEDSITEIVTVMNEPVDQLKENKKICSDLKNYLDFFNRLRQG